MLLFIRANWDAFVTICIAYGCVCCIYNHLRPLRLRTHCGITTLRKAGRHCHVNCNVQRQAPETINDFT